MAEANVVKTEVGESRPVGEVEGKPGRIVVTQENFKDYVDEKLPKPAEEEENPDPEAVAAAEHAKAEAEKNAPKEGDTDGSKVYFKGKWVNKHDFSYRLHVQTEAKTKEAEAKVTAAEAKIKEQTEAREAAEKREAELKARYEPPKGDLGPEPDPAQFTDVKEYSKAIKEWQAEKTEREFSERQTKEFQATEKARVEKSWNDRQAAAKTAIPDYAEKIAGSDVKISDQLRDAIIESEVGPEILYHLATNKDVADALGKLTVGRMLREIGKLEAQLGGQAKPAAKSEPAVEPVEVSQAPAPITPLRGVNAPVGVLHGHDEVPKNMTYDQWKKKWNKGEIK